MKITPAQLQLISYYREAQSQLTELRAVVGRAKVAQSSQTSSRSSEAQKNDRARAVILSSSLKALLELQKIKRSELEEKRSKKDQK
jgi:hypothetical protein